MMPSNILEVLDKAPPYDPGFFDEDETRIEKRSFVNMGDHNIYLGWWSCLKNE